MMLEIQVLACDGHKNVAGLNRLMEPQPSIAGSPTAIQTLKKNPDQIHFHSIEPRAITKMNNNINTASTIARSRLDYESSVSDPF